MGERRREAFRVEIGRSVKIKFRGAQVTSDAGLPAFLKLDEALGSAGIAANFLTDTRTGQNTRHGPVAQLRNRSCPLHLLPDGGGVDLTESVRGHPATDSAVDATGAGVTTQPLGEIDDWIRDRERKDSWSHYCVGTPRKRVRSTLRKSKSGQAT